MKNLSLRTNLGQFLFENQNVTSHQGGGGPKIGQKSVTYYLNGPYRFPLQLKGNVHE